MAAAKGNKYATRAKKWRDALERALAHRDEQGGRCEGTTLFEIASVVITNALAGDKDSINEIANRLDGKPVQAVVGDEEGPPIRLEGRIRLVRPD